MKQAFKPTKWKIIVTVLLVFIAYIIEQLLLAVLNSTLGACVAYVADCGYNFLMPYSLYTCGCYTLVSVIIAWGVFITPGIITYSLYSVVQYFRNK